MKMNEATRRQITAARPDSSTWLTANAGSGKTRVLTDRVARLLLSGADPQHILCLTYTKAAAGEMQNRLFRTLGKWAMMEDGALGAELRGKGVSGDLDLAQARRLFARAIETPGGLKIQTIHSFCASLLRRFPLEAGVSPQFQEMDDRMAQLLRQEVLDQMAQEGGAAEQALRDLALIYTGNAFDGLCAELVRRADLFLSGVPQEGLAKALGADPKTTLTRLLETELDGVHDLLKRLVAALLSGSVTDQKHALRLQDLPDEWSFDSFSELATICLYGEKAKLPFGPKTDRFPTKSVRAAHPDLVEEVDELLHLVADLRPKILAQAAFEQSLILYQFASRFVPRIRARMQARGLLGFDDLITKARDLLTAPEVAAWVLWRLDGGIDHILVDEAQDTSLVQWDVIRLLAQEFAAGKGARGDLRRTLFVVGDRKQSIYSFQGADPAAFNQMNAHFEARLAGGEAPLTTLSLDHSFRSSRAILDLVDRVFAGPAAQGLEADVTHLAFREALPGRVDLLPPVEPLEQEEDAAAWTNPVDRVSPRAPELRLAQQIAARIRHMIDHEALPVERDGAVHLRPMTEGDFLILVRRRGVLFDALLRAAKQEGLRVAGADRLRLGAEIAVRDIKALLQFLALPEDDLSLAVALKSPLFGWSETDLFRLAHGREGYLWAALRASKSHALTLEILNDLRGQADFLRPYDLISRLLVRHGGRQALLARLGAEAEEGIDALLSQAMAYEQVQVPSLTGFLIWLDAEDVEIKRQQSAGQDALRVMTVHGSKGLEAPIVILPDTAKRRIMDRGALLREGGLGFWRPKAGLVPEPLGALIARDRQAEEEENRRLLYVGMTRAEQWLIVAGAGDVGQGDESWYGMIAAAMKGAREMPDGALRIEHGQWDGALVAPPAPPPAAAPQLPPAAPLPAPARRAALLSPSDLGGAKALPGDAGLDQEEAMARGVVLHSLLEHLPRVAPEARAALAERIAPDRADLIAEAQALLAAPDLAELFAKGRAEVSISAVLPELSGARIAGQVDLLIEQEGAVLAVDFKSNAVVPRGADEVPEGILRQMGAYGAALRQIFPGRPVRLAILWTRTGQLMPLPENIAAAALARADVT